MSVRAGLPNTAKECNRCKASLTDGNASGTVGVESIGVLNSHGDPSVCLENPPTIPSKDRDSNPSEYVNGSRSSSPADSVFKRIFKYYKRRSPSPDLSNVIDFRASLLPEGVVYTPFKAADSISTDALSALGLKPLSDWKLFTIASRQGLFILSDIFEPSRHLEWIARCLNVYPEPPSKTNVGLHIPNVTKIFENHANRLRWATLGYHYDWTTKVYPPSGNPLPVELVSAADLISRVLGIGAMQADAVIINYYPPKSTLSAHVDRSERFISRPLISLSFGQSAVYLSGGKSLDDPVDAFLLHSGDVLVMHGDQRLIYHAVPRIQKMRNFEGTAQFSRQIVDYANNNRVNVTIRQVDRH